MTYSTTMLPYFDFQVVEITVQKYACWIFTCSNVWVVQELRHTQDVDNPNGNHKAGAELS